MVAAGETALDSLRALASMGRSLVSEALAGADGFYEWRHYPEGDVYDPGSHAQYFYHAHPPGERAASEHGHFHAFLRPHGMPAGVQPLMLPAFQGVPTLRDQRIAPETGSRP